MRDSGAPEARGSNPTARCRLARRIGALVVVVLAFASPFSPSDDSAFATAGAADATPRGLQVAPSDVRPNFALPALDGSRHELRQQAGRVVLVHFFATWCEPCRKELTSLSRLAERPGAERLSILAVNVAEVPTRVRRFLDAAPVSFPVLLDADRAVTKAWGVSILPTTFVLDRALVARLFVEGDVDWTRADVLAALERVSSTNSQ
jgi:peroxiredoxin